MPVAVVATAAGCSSVGLAEEPRRSLSTGAAGSVAPGLARRYPGDRILLWALALGSRRWSWRFRDRCFVFYFYERSETGAHNSYWRLVRRRYIRDEPQV